MPSELLLLPNTLVLPAVVLLAWVVHDEVLLVLDSKATLALLLSVVCVVESVLSFAGMAVAVCVAFLQAYFSASADRDARECGIALSRVTHAHRHIDDGRGCGEWGVPVVHRRGERRSSERMRTE